MIFSSRTSSSSREKTKEEEEEEESPLCLGQCRVDLSLLARVFPFLDGYYHLVEPGSASRVVGQLRVQVCPDWSLVARPEPLSWAAVPIMVGCLSLWTRKEHAVPIFFG